MLDISPVILVFLTRLLDVKNHMRTREYLGVFGLELQEAAPASLRIFLLLTWKYHILSTKTQLPRSHWRKPGMKSEN